MSGRTNSRDVQILQARYPNYVDQVGRNATWNYVFFILEASAFSVSLAIFSQDVILPYLISRLTSQPVFIGIISAIFYLGFYIPQILGAYLVHGRTTRKGVVFRITLIQRIATFLLALIVQAIHLLPDPVILVLFLAAYTFFALTNGMIGPPYSDLINKTILYHRGLFYGLLTGVTSLVGFGASLLAKYLLENYTFPLNFKWMFWIAFGISTLSPFCVAAFRETPFPVANPPEKVRDYFRSIPTILASHPLYVRYLVARALVGIAFMANAFYAVYMVEHYNLSVGTLALFAMLVLASKSGLGFVFGWVGDRFGYKLVLMGIALSLFLQALCALIAPTPSFFWLIAVLIGGVLSGIGISDPNMIFEIAPPGETGRFIGITNTLVGPVMVLAPMLGGLLVNTFAYSALFGVCLVIAFIGFFFTWLAFEEPRSVVSQGGLE